MIIISVWMYLSRVGVRRRFIVNLLRVAFLTRNPTYMGQRLVCVTILYMAQIYPGFAGFRCTVNAHEHEIVKLYEASEFAPSPSNPKPRDPEP